MGRERKADELPQDEAEPAAKVAKVTKESEQELVIATPQPAPATPATPAALAAEGVSEPRLRSEVQALLVGIDLESVTVGELRGRLEARLGLETGAFYASKRLRRRLGLALQHEVAKRAQRGADCERIAKALVELEGYPTASLQMLLDGLPHAVAATGGEGAPRLHLHQARFLSIARDALDDARRDTLVAQATCEAEASVAGGKLRESEAAKDTAAAAQALARQHAEALAASLAAAEREVRRSEAELAEKEEAMRQALEVGADCRKAGLAAAALSKGPLRTLHEGVLPDDDTKETALAEVLLYLEGINAETSLQSAVPVALRKCPEDRTKFDRISLDMLDQMIAEQIGEGDEDGPAARAEFEAEAAKLMAATMLDFSRTRAAEQAEALASALRAQEGAVASLRGVEAEVSEHRAASDSLLAEGALLAARLQELEGVLALIDGLINGAPISTAIGAVVAAAGGEEEVDGRRAEGEEENEADAEAANVEVEDATHAELEQHEAAVENQIMQVKKVVPEAAVRRPHRVSEGGA